MALKDRSGKSDASAFSVATFAHLVGVAIIALVLVWLLHLKEGVALESNSDTRNEIFNLHPLLMALGFILISGEAIMAHKTVTGAKDKRKLTHLVLHFIALLCGIIGVFAVFKFHAKRNIPHLYTLHSWLGISTICLFALQWVFSFLSFFYPKAKELTRAKVVPWHAVFGMLIFLMAILSAEIGLSEKFFFDLHRPNERSTNYRHQELVVINFIGLLILIFGASVGVTALIHHN